LERAFEEVEVRARGDGRGASGAVAPGGRGEVAAGSPPLRHALIGHSQAAPDGRDEVAAGEAPRANDRASAGSAPAPRSGSSQLPLHSLRRSVDLRYAGQTYELTIPVPDGPIDVAGLV